ncbi:hypothetical protein ACX0G9_02320 [Flavitalea flava]
MKTGSDDELQQWLDSPAPSQEMADIPVADLQAYRLLFELLGQEPPSGLSPSFSAKVIERAKEKAYRRSNRRFYLWTIAIFCTGLAIAYCLMAVISHQSTAQLLAVFGKYKGIGLFALSLLLILQYMDYRLAKIPASSQ